MQPTASRRGKRHFAKVVIVLKPSQLGEDGLLCDLCVPTVNSRLVYQPTELGIVPQRLHGLDHVELVLPRAFRHCVPANIAHKAFQLGRQKAWPPPLRLIGNLFQNSVFQVHCLPPVFTAMQSPWGKERSRFLRVPKSRNKTHKT